VRLADEPAERTSCGTLVSILIGWPSPAANGERARAGDFGVTSVNDAVAELLARAGAPS
jgi:hypothetical protein